MTTTAWAHLPNARHIDAVLAHAKAHPGRWRGDGVGTSWPDAWDALLDAARGAVWDALQYSAWAASSNTSWVTIRGACLALFAVDDAGLLMDMPVDAVRTLAAAGHPPAVLILPARLAMSDFNKE